MFRIAHLIISNDNTAFFFSLLLAPDLPIYALGSHKFIFPDALWSSMRFINLSTILAVSSILLGASASPVAEAGFGTHVPPSMPTEKIVSIPPTHLGRLELVLIPLKLRNVFLLQKIIRIAEICMGAAFGYLTQEPPSVKVVA